MPDNLTNQNDANQTQQPNNTSELPGLDLAFNLTKELFPIQLTRLNSLDSKANFALGAATALMSAAFVLKPLVLSFSSSQHTNCYLFLAGFLQTLSPILRQVITSLPTLLLLIVYLVALNFAYRAYWIRTLNQVPNPRSLLDYYVYARESLYKTKGELLETMAQKHVQNELLLNEKASLIERAFIALLIEAILLGLLLFLQVTCY